MPIVRFYTEFSNVKGAGDVEMVGKVLLYANLVRARQISQIRVSPLNDVENAINEQNVQVAVGQVATHQLDGRSLMAINLVGQSYYSDPETI